MPAAMASRVLRNRHVVPRMVISPLSGRSAPARTLVRVDFPAPLSPTRATISPWPTWKSTRSSALTPPKVLAIWVNSRRGPDAGTLASPSCSGEAELLQPGLQEHREEDDRADEHLVREPRLGW